MVSIWPVDWMRTWLRDREEEEEGRLWRRRTKKILDWWRRFRRGRRGGEEGEGRRERASGGRNGVQGVVHRAHFGAYVWSGLRRVWVWVGGCLGGGRGRGGGRGKRERREGKEGEVVGWGGVGGLSSKKNWSRDRPVTLLWNSLPLVGNH